MTTKKKAAPKNVAKKAAKKPAKVAAPAPRIAPKPAPKAAPKPALEVAVRFLRQTAVGKGHFNRGQVGVFPVEVAEGLLDDGVAVRA